MTASDTTQDDEYTASIVMPRAMAEQADLALRLITVPLAAFDTDFGADIQLKPAFRSRELAQRQVSRGLAAAIGESEDVEIDTTAGTRRAIRAACQAAKLFQQEAPNVASLYRLDADLLNDVCAVMEEVEAAIADVSNQEGVSDEH